MADPSHTLRAWRVPLATRWALVGGLMTVAVACGVTGQALLTGFASLGVLVLSAMTLAGLAAFLLWAYQGDIVVSDTAVALPDGPAVPLRRVHGCHAEAGGGGGILVLDLVGPPEQRRVVTGQPLAEVEALARLLPLSA